MRRSEAEAEFMSGFDSAATQDAAEFKRLDARIAELEKALCAIASRDIPHPDADRAEVDFAAAVCDRLGIAYETKWDK